MSPEHTILIADKNPHVRKFLTRELIAEGYHVIQAKSGHEVIQSIYNPAAIHLVVIDPEFSDMEPAEILRRIKNRLPLLPAVIHSFANDTSRYESEILDTDFVEKQGESIEILKKVIFKILNKPQYMAGSFQIPEKSVVP